MRRGHGSTASWVLHQDAIGSRTTQLLVPTTAGISVR
jgi:hypothetical protein